MKSRVSTDHIPAMYRDACKRVVNDEWSRVRKAVTERSMYAIALALNDMRGYGNYRIKRVLTAWAEIVNGYSDEAYGGKDSADMERMNEALRAELKRRRIEIEFN